MQMDSREKGTHPEFIEGVWTNLCASLIFYLFSCDNVKYCGIHYGSHHVIRINAKK